MRYCVCAVFITYHPDAEFALHVKKVMRQINNIVIIDNTPGDKLPDIIWQFVHEQKISVINNNDNPGIARALNQGIEWAKQNGFDWAVTFDQDTEITDDFLETVFLPMAEDDTPDLIAVIGANYINRNNNEIGIPVALGCRSYIEVKDVITSGCLISVEKVHEIGGFDDKLFIDMVDTDMCIRARIAGYKVLLSAKPIMYHSIGNVEARNFLGKNFNVTNHAPLRRYYIFRNTIYLVKKFAWFDIAWCLEMVFNYLPKVFVKACIFEEKRTLNLSYIAQGIWDGLISRFRAPQSLK